MNARATKMIIDLNAFRENMKNIEKIAKGKTLIPVVKAMGYGTHINERVDILNDYNIVAVAIADEGMRLRDCSYNGEILILNQPCIDEIDEILENNLTVGLSSFDFLNRLVEIKRDIHVHLEIETGMNRTGIKLEDIAKFVEIIKSNDFIKVDGVYTHLSIADEDEEYTKHQYETFEKAVNIIKESFDLKYIHMSASNGIMFYEETLTNAVRPGIIMYGYSSTDRQINVDIKPVAKLKSKITFIKEINEGESVGYSRSYISDKKMRVATIPIGYADGLRRAMSNGGEVVINGKKAKIIGKVCMDSIMVDITDIDASLNDEVYIWDNSIVTLEDIAKRCDTINYEILSEISDRVPREFIN